jgi:CHAT domain-containing protein
VLRKISRVAGIDLPGAPPAPADITLAARDGPLVYLAAAEKHGYALVVQATGPPSYLPLPGLTRAGVADQVGKHLSKRDFAEASSAIRWLWENGIADLAKALPAGALVTIIPAGQLSLLPIHAAGGPGQPGQLPADWTFLADRVMVRYAHNARTLLRARERAEGFSRSSLSLLAVAAPQADPQGELPDTVLEIMRVAQQWVRADTVPDGHYATVQQALALHNVWHFACHGESIPDRVLDSALLLTGARLSLRDILAQPPMPRRLALLSACETHLSSADLPDEAMGTLSTGRRLR